VAWPGKGGARKIEESFKGAKSMQYKLQPSAEPSISGDTAVVKCLRIVQIPHPRTKEVITRSKRKP
jgi:hypothetical protein